MLSQDGTVAAEPTSPAIPLRPAPVETPALELVPDRPSVDTAALARRINWRFSLLLPAINLTTIVVTYVFLVYVVPLPGPRPNASQRELTLIVAIVMTLLGWVACERIGKRSFMPVRRWLDRQGPPDEDELTRTIRQPVVQAANDVAIWLVAAITFGVLAVATRSSVGAGALIAVLIVLGGLSSSALTYFAVEWIMRPVLALALESDPRARPLLPSIGTRVYLAWEAGTAIAIGGIVVVAIAYLSGSAISPHRMAATVIFLGAIALILGAVMILAAIRSVVDPLRKLRVAMKELESGNAEVTVPVDDGSEVGLMQAAFNRMVAGLRERDRVRDLFGRHVGEEVARSALARGLELGGELRVAAVLFVDVVGSTAFAARRDPREVVETLNHFFEIVVDVVTVYGGWVNKFEGDSALCAFGAPTEHPDAAAAALAAGRELRDRLRRELDGLDAAIGLSAGTVVAGNIGAARRYEYTVIGDPVNEAARLTELAKSRECRLLASEAIVTRAGAREAPRWRLGESLVLRGRSAPTRIAAPA